MSQATIVTSMLFKHKGGEQLDGGARAQVQRGRAPGAAAGAGAAPGRGRACAPPPRARRQPAHHR